MSVFAPADMRYRIADTRFPKGWFCVADLSDLPEDGMRPVSLLDMQMVVYRRADGQPQVADAYCPHLGAHLASSDGCVRGGRLICPFHKWEFDGTSGRVVAIPYTKQVPNVTLALHPTVVADGKIMMWFDPAGGAPESTPYASDEYGDSDDWVVCGFREWEVTVPFPDILENLFDTAHFMQLHQTETTPAIKTFERTNYGLRILYDVDPSLNPMFPVQRMEFHFTGVTGMTQYFEGPGWKVLTAFSFTPIDEQRTWQRVRLFQAESNPAEWRDAITSSVIDKICTEVEQDLKVINFKKHIPQPMLCAGDGPINKYREYAKSYYS